VSVEAYLAARSDVAKTRDEFGDVCRVIGVVYNALASDPGHFAFVKEDYNPTSLEGAIDLEAVEAVEAVDPDQWPNPEQIMQVLARYLVAVEHMKDTWRALPAELQAILKTPDDLFPPEPVPPQSSRSTWSP
jgi:hypothetical protein